MTLHMFSGSAGRKRQQTKDCYEALCGAECLLFVHLAARLALPKRLRAGRGRFYRQGRCVSLSHTLDKGNWDIFRLNKN
jgi:hypothetical protein